MDRLFSRTCCNRTQGNDFKIEKIRYKKFLYIEYGEILAQVAQSWWLPHSWMCPSLHCKFSSLVSIYGFRKHSEVLNKVLAN